MKNIDELLRKLNQLSTGDDEADVFIKVKLKMIRGLFEDIKGSEDRIYMEEIISKFAEIVECQQQVIGGLILEAAAEAGYGPTQHSWISADGRVSPKKTACHLNPDDIPWDPDETFEPENPIIPPYMPPEEGFQTDEQVKKAFTTYLTHYAKRKSGKPFSGHTIYDYSSRIRVLMGIVYQEWQENNCESQIRLREQGLQPDTPFLNAYHNLPALKAYVSMKEEEIREISMGLRVPDPESLSNPLSNARNLGNTAAALTRFEEFKKSIDNR